jgi:N-acetylmuramoyl-L-alanine amidase
MATGNDFLKRGKTKLGSKYVLGVITPKNDPNASVFDCAEFISWDIYQEIKKLYGCANNSTTNLASADAYSGFWGRDALNGTVEKIPVGEALVTEGAILLRMAANGLIGHIVFTDGRGKTVEAHSTKKGVIEYVTAGRRWDMGIKIPDVEYKIISRDTDDEKPKEKIYRFTHPMMYDKYIKKIQAALSMPKKDQDGWYGAKTFAAVRAFQISKGLVPDGEVGSKTLKALKLI